MLRRLLPETLTRSLREAREAAATDAYRRWCRYTWCDFGGRSAEANGLRHSLMFLGLLLHFTMDRVA